MLPCRHGLCLSRCRYRKHDRGCVGGGAAGIGVLLRMYGNRFLGIFSKKHRERAAATAAELVGTPDTPE